MPLFAHERSEDRLVTSFVAALQLDASEQATQELMTVIQAVVETVRSLPCLRLCDFVCFLSCLWERGRETDDWGEGSHRGAVCWIFTSRVILVL